MSRYEALDIPQVERKISLYQEDYLWLFERFSQAGGTIPMGVGPFIRELVHSKVKELRDKEARAMDTKEEAAQ